MPVTPAHPPAWLRLGIMAHSYISSVFHVVFSTKERINLIGAEFQPRLWNYVSAIRRNIHTNIIAIGGTENHVHVLLALGADQKLADTVRILKCNSSQMDAGGESAIWMAGGLRRVQREPRSVGPSESVYPQSGHASQAAFV